MADPGHVELLTGWGRTAPTAASVVAPDDDADVDALLAPERPAGLDRPRPRPELRRRGPERRRHRARRDRARPVRSATSIPTPASRASTAGVSLDALDPRACSRSAASCPSPRARVSSPSAARSPPTSTGRTTTSTAASPTTSSRSRCTRRSRSSTSRPTSDPELFWGTAGGLGLTGVVTEVTLRLLPVETSLLRSTPNACPDLDTVMARMLEGDADYRYSVAWIDCLARGASLGRSVLSLRRPRAPRRPPAAQARPAAAPSTHARSCSRAPVGAERAAQPAEHRGVQRVLVPGGARVCTAALETIAAFFHPLDGVRGWNRIYGSRGFLQYQYVVPDEATETVRRTLEMLSDGTVRRRSSRCSSASAPGNPGPLSFPAPGWTLALDIPAGGARPRPSCSTTSTSSWSTPAAACTWPRTPACAPSCSPRCTPSSTASPSCAPASIPSGVLQSDLAAASARACH